MNVLKFSVICWHHMLWQWDDLKTCRLKCGLLILSPTEDASKQRRSFSVVLLKMQDMAAPSSSRRASGTLCQEHLMGSQNPNAPNKFVEDKRRKVDRQKINENIMVLFKLLYFPFLCNYCTFWQYHNVYFWCLWMCFQCCGCRFTANPM